MPIAACLLVSCLNVLLVMTCSLKLLSILDSSTVCLIHRHFSYRNTCTTRIILRVLIACILSRGNESNQLYHRSITAKYLQEEVVWFNFRKAFIMSLTCILLIFPWFHTIMIWWLRQEYSLRYCFSTSTVNRGGNENHTIISVFYLI